MLEEAKEHVLLSTIAVKPVVDKYKIESLFLCDKSGEFAIDAKIFLDCSGDGDIAKKAGVSYTIGDENGSMTGQHHLIVTGQECIIIFGDNRSHFHGYTFQKFT